MTSKKHISDPTHFRKSFPPKDWMGSISLSLICWFSQHVGGNLWILPFPVLLVQHGFDILRKITLNGDFSKLSVLFPAILSHTMAHIFATTSLPSSIATYSCVQYRNFHFLNLFVTGYTLPSLCHCNLQICEIIYSNHHHPPKSLSLSSSSSSSSLYCVCYGAVVACFPRGSP